MPDLLRTLWEISLPCRHTAWAYAIWLASRMPALLTPRYVFSRKPLVWQRQKMWKTVHRLDANETTSSGGTLRMKHRGQTMDFAWAADNPQAIQWAASYGDCEHEVLEVTRGHRVILTYNLYYTWIGRLAQPVSTPYHLPLYNIVRDMLQEPTFMSQGKSC